MLEQLRDISRRVGNLRKSIKSQEAQQVRRKTDRDVAMSLVDEYFRQLRDKLEISGLSSDSITQLDQSMHQLLEASRKHSAKRTYEEILEAVEQGLFAAEKSALVGPSRSPSSELEPTDKAIVETLTEIVPSAARAYEQALQDLTGPDRLSWRGSATDLREALREVLDHLAPDSDVEGSDGFKFEKDQKSPTMKQKVRYVLKKRGRSASSSKVPEQSVDAVDEIVGGFVRSVYARSSISTHTPTERSEVLRIHGYVRPALCELLEIHQGDEQ